MDWHFDYPALPFQYHYLLEASPTIFATFVFEAELDSMIKVDHRTDQ
jgi:hypothetical protein